MCSVVFNGIVRSTIARKSPSTDNVKAARRQRDLIKDKVEDARNTYYKDLIDMSKGDPRKYWANINELTGKTKKEE